MLKKTVSKFCWRMACRIRKASLQYVKLVFAVVCVFSFALLEMPKSKLKRPTTKPFRAVSPSNSHFVNKRTSNLQPFRQIETLEYKNTSLQLRCSALFLGCFCKVKSNIIATVLMVKTVSNAQQCFYACSKREAKLSALDGTTCMCAHRISPGAVMEHSKHCNRTLSLPTESSCSQNDPSLELYFNPAPCVKVDSITNNILTTSFVGKIKVEPRFIEEASALSTEQAQMPLQCLLYCESRYHTLALLEANGACHCGQTTFNFRLSGSVVQSKEQQSVLSVYRTNIPDYRCASRRFMPEDSFEPVALVSRPGSGNTWLRYLIESATGFYTGSVYNDVSLVSKGFLGEFGSPKSGRIQVFKDHTTSFKKITRKAIVLIRNPYDVCVAEFNRRKTSHTGLRDPQDFETRQWTETCNRLANRWLSMNKEYVAAAGKVLVVYFENLLKDHSNELRKIVSFLGITVENLETRLLCLEDNSEGYFKRRERKEDFDPFQGAQVKVIDEYIRTLRKHFASYNLPSVPIYERK